MSLQANLAGKQLANEVVALALDLVASEPADVARRFWEVVVQEAQKRLPARSVKPNRDGPMDDQEARRFERRTMSFGQHHGKQIGDVPLSYLVWLDEESRGFQLALHRYLASDRIQQQIEDLDGGEEWTA